MFKEISFIFFKGFFILISPNGSKTLEIEELDFEFIRKKSTFLVIMSMKRKTLLNPPAFFVDLVRISASL